VNSKLAKPVEPFPSLEAPSEEVPSEKTFAAQPASKLLALLAQLGLLLLVVDQFQIGGLRCYAF
jgi:hypothetical protein